MKHDWRRGPTVGFDGTTAYVCIRCGESGNHSYHPEIEEYDINTTWERRDLEEIGPIAHYDPTSVNGLATVDWEGECG